MGTKQDMKNLRKSRQSAAFLTLEDFGLDGSLYFYDDTTSGLKPAKQGETWLSIGVDNGDIMKFQNFVSQNVLMPLLDNGAKQPLCVVQRLNGDVTFFCEKLDANGGWNMFGMNAPGPKTGTINVPASLDIGLLGLLDSVGHGVKPLQKPDWVFVFQEIKPWLFEIVRPARGTERIPAHPAKTSLYFTMHNGAFVFGLRKPDGGWIYDDLYGDDDKWKDRFELDV